MVCPCRPPEANSPVKVPTTLKCGDGPEPRSGGQAVAGGKLRAPGARRVAGTPESRRGDQKAGGEGLCSDRPGGAFLDTPAPFPGGSLGLAPGYNRNGPAGLGEWTHVPERVRLVGRAPGVSRRRAFASVAPAPIARGQKIIVVMKY